MGHLKKQSEKTSSKLQRKIKETYRELVQEYQDFT